MEDVSTKGLSTKATGKPLRGRRFTRIASRKSLHESQTHVRLLPLVISHIKHVINTLNRLISYMSNIEQGGVVRSC